MSALDLQLTDLMREFLWTVLMVAGPALLVGLVVGILVSIVQALTSIQEQTMTLVPKMLAVFAVSLLLLAPALGILRDYALAVFGRLVSFGLS